MRRGDVRWYTFKPPDKRRPVLILTRDSAIPFLSEITVAPITSTIRGIPTEVLLASEDGMPDDCAVNFDHIQTVPKAQIGKLIAVLSAEKMTEASDPVLFALGFEAENV